MTEPIDSQGITQAELIKALQVPVSVPTDPAPQPAAPGVDATAEAVIKKLRAEAAANRVRATEAEQAKAASEQELEARINAAAQAAAEKTQAELTAKWGKALGITPEETPADPDALYRQAEAARLAAEQAKTASESTAQQRAQEARDAKVALETLRRAARIDGVDADALLDSSTFRAKLTGLDPNAEDFHATVDAHIQHAIGETPARYMRPTGIGGVNPRSGADFSGGNGGTDEPAGPITVESQLKQLQQQNKAGHVPQATRPGQSTPLPADWADRFA